MSDDSKKRRPPPGDVHERIVRMSRALREAAKASESGPMFLLPEQARELDSLLLAGLRSIEVRVPASFEFEGRTYFLRALATVAGVDVFANAGDEVPVIEGFGRVGGPAGHQRGH